MQFDLEDLRAGYQNLWDTMHPTTMHSMDSIEIAAKRVANGRGRYLTVEAVTKVPWKVIGILHLRESNCNFNTWLHNGDPMKRHGLPVRTRNVPANRPPNPDVTWERGAYDSLILCQGYDKVTDWSIPGCAFVFEKYNGDGYFLRNIPSPYLWGGTNHQVPGKFIRDHVFATHDEHGQEIWDPQIGCMPVLKEITNNANTYGS